MKYLAIAACGARQVLRSRGETLARGAFLIVLLVAFSRLWVVMAESGRLGGISGAAFVWYLAITECVALATGMFYVDLEEEVRRGDVAYRIVRPVSYVWGKLAEWSGDALVRALFLAAVGGAGAWALTGAAPPHAPGLLLALPLVALAVVVMLLFQAAIGLSTFWLQEAQPVFWIFQKVLFVLGGLMIPIEIYPEWMQTLARCTPFEPMLHGCGAMAFGFDPAAAAWTAGKLVGWGLVAAALVAWLYRRGLRVLDVNGG